MKKDIKLLVMDVDGTLTNGKIYIGPLGEIFKAFDCKDGYAIAHMLPENGIVPVIITGRTSDIVSARCQELHITEVHQGVIDKLPVLEAVVEKYGCTLDNVAYVGDDLPDLPCMQVCGLRGCPADAVKKVKEVCDYVAASGAGAGAVREFIAWILE